MSRGMLWAWLVGVGVCVGAGAAAPAAENPEVSITVAPARYISVNGDAGTFREHHWKKDGYAGGISQFSLKHGFANGIEFETGGHALVDQNDIGLDVSLAKEGLGFVTLDFTEFRKYYSGQGGVYQRFGSLSSVDTDKQLALDIGKLELETGLTLEGWPELTFGYEREFKDGTKSRLTWSEAEQTVSGTDTTRNIVPSWQEIDEIVDVFSLGLAHEIAGFDLGAEQRWEFMRTETMRQELDVSTTHGSGDDKLRMHEMDPEATLMTTLVHAQRSFQEDKAFFSTAYRFGHMDNREFETIIESNSLTGVITNFSQAEQKQAARSDVDYDTHTWVATTALHPGGAWAVTTKLKAEVIKEEGNSSYPSYADSTPEAYDTVLDRTELSLANNKATRWGEGLSLRFSGIPKTALYTELELEQARALIREDRQSIDGPDTGNDSSGGEVLARETVTDVRRGSVTFGGQAAPWPFLNVTAHVRHRRNNNDYDDQKETAFSSAFIDWQSVNTNEFMTRATLRPCRWFRTSLRYTFRDDDFSSAVQGQAIVKTGAASHMYVADVNLQPVRPLLLTGSFARQTSMTTTPSRYGASPNNIPTFNANVNTWLFGADYAVGEGLAVNSTMQYSRARNFNDYSTTGMPYGSDFDYADIAAGLTWSLAEGASVSGGYEFYYYQPNSNWNNGEYDAHEVWLKLSKAF